MLRYGMATGPSVCSTTIVFRWRPLWFLQQLQPHHGIALGSHRDRRLLHLEPRVVAGHGQDTLRRGFVEDISGSGADLHVEWLANRAASGRVSIIIRAYSTQARATPHRTAATIYSWLGCKELVVRPLMIPLLIIMCQVRLVHIAKGGFAHHDHLLQGFFFDRAHKPFAVGIEIRDPC
jgi:hypothetical protein